VRGISVCDRWKDSFVNFISDLGNRPKGMTLGRIDNDGNYTPDNCLWQTHKDQARNRRSNRIIIYNGKSLTLQEWSEKTLIPRDTLSKRIESGWSIKDSLTKPLRGSVIRHFGLSI